MPNIEKVFRNNKILALDAKGWREVKIANMLHEKESTVSMVICRARWKQFAEFCLATCAPGDGCEPRSQNMTMAKLMELCPKRREK